MEPLFPLSSAQNYTKAALTVILSMISPGHMWNPRQESLIQIGTELWISLGIYNPLLEPMEGLFQKHRCRSHLVWNGFLYPLQLPISPYKLHYRVILELHPAKYPHQSTPIFDNCLPLLCSIQIIFFASKTTGMWLGMLALIWAPVPPNSSPNPLRGL